MPPFRVKCKSSLEPLQRHATASAIRSILQIGLFSITHWRVFFWYFYHAVQRLLFRNDLILSYFSYCLTYFIDLYTAGGHIVKLAMMPSPNISAAQYLSSPPANKPGRQIKYHTQLLLPLFHSPRLLLYFYVPAHKSSRRCKRQKALFSAYLFQGRRFLFWRFPAIADDSIDFDLFRLPLCRWYILLLIAMTICRRATDKFY